MTEGSRYLKFSSLSVMSALYAGFAFYLLRILLFSRLSESDYAAVYAAMALSQIVLPLLAFGLGPAMIPQVAHHAARRDNSGLRCVYAVAMTWQGVLGLLFAALIFPNAGLLAQCFIPWAGNGAWIIRQTALFTVGAVLCRTVLATLMGVEAVLYRSLAEAAYATAVIAGAFVLTAYAPRPAAPLGAYLLGIVLMLTVARAGLARAVPVFRRPAWPHPFFPILRRLIGEGKYLTLVFFGLVIFSQLDTIMLSLLRQQPAEVAGYQVAVPTAVILQTLLLAATQPLVPMAARASSEKRLDLLAAPTENVWRWSWTVLFPGAVLMAVFGDVLMQTLFGSDVHGATKPFAVFALTMPAYLLCWFHVQLLAGLRAAPEAARAVAVGLCLNVALNLALIPPMGALGAALATGTGFTAGALASARSLRRRTPFPIPWRDILLGAGAGCICGGVALLSRQTVLFKTAPLLLSVLSAAVLWLAALGILQAVGAAQMEALARLLSKTWTPRRRP